LLLDVLAAADNLHLEENHTQKFEIHSLVSDLICHINIEFNFDCSKLILDVVDLVIGH
jgi:hypothetical protein